MSLTDLPLDVLDTPKGIVTYLSFTDLAALKATCRSFDCFIDLKAYSPTRQEVHHYLLAAEMWPLYNHRVVLSQEDWGEKEKWGVYNLSLACSICLRLRPFEAFTDAQRRSSAGKNGKRAPGGRDAHKRFCFDCGIAHKRFQVGTTMTFNKKTLVICSCCRRLSEASYEELWQTPRAWVRNGKRTCARCAPKKRGREEDRLGDFIYDPSEHQPFED